MRLLPPTTIPGRILAISVQLDHLQAMDRTTARRSALEPLLRAFEQYQIPATWAFETPSTLDAFPRSHGEAMGHELAAVCAPCDGTERQTQMVATLRSFRQASISISTILSTNDPPTAHFESLVRMGINLVALGAAASGSAEPIATLRFGLWRLATSWGIPSEGWLGIARGRRRLDRAIRRNEPFHVMVHGEAVLQSPPAARMLDRFLQHVDRRREDGMLEVVTLSGIARQLARPRTSATAESILRARAA